MVEGINCPPRRRTSLHGRQAYCKWDIDAQTAGADSMQHRSIHCAAWRQQCLGRVRAQTTRAGVDWLTERFKTEDSGSTPQLERFVVAAALSAHAALHASDLPAGDSHNFRTAAHRDMLRPLTPGLADETRPLPKSASSFGGSSLLLTGAFMPASALDTGICSRWPDQRGQAPKLSLMMARSAASVRPSWLKS